MDAGLLPQVIAGTSAGGLVAALVCTRTNDELKALLIPELAHKITACEEPVEVWIKRFWKTGARFDSVTWARKVCCLRFDIALNLGLIQDLVRILYKGLGDFPRGLPQDGTDP